MLRYSELTTSQKRLINKMRIGYELRHEHGKWILSIHNDNYTDILRADTPNSLLKRGFIRECSNDNGVRTFCVNVEIEGFGTKF